MSTLAKTRTSPVRALLYGGLAAGTLDIVFAISFWALKGIPAMRVFQSVAAGLLGREAANAGGATTAILGAGLHYFIATMMVATYYLVSRRFEGLIRFPIRYGIPYGLLLYLIMNFVVLPLSAAAPTKPHDLSWWLSAGVLCSLPVHAAVGVICALFSRMASGRR